MHPIENAEIYLRQNGISPSYQRKRIFEYLSQTDTHPTVSDIYEGLIKEIPSLSKTTVYNTLNLFIEKNIAEAILIEASEARYDLFNPVHHAHFKCLQCHKVYDIPLPKDSIQIEALKGFEIQQQQHHFKGICKICKKNN
jgi:Fe2+ or Zn2+ uptake regulation protein